MAEELYNVQVAGDPPTGSFYIDNGYQTWTQPNTYTWSYASTVYMYQLICPRCNTTNWGQIDKTITCSGKVGPKSKQYCGAKLKAIKEVVDFEVPVG
jgi:hypothetical protein